MSRVLKLGDVEADEEANALLRAEVLPFHPVIFCHRTYSTSEAPFFKRDALKTYRCIFSSVMQWIIYRWISFFQAWCTGLPHLGCGRSTVSECQNGNQNQVDEFSPVVLVFCWLGPLVRFPAYAKNGTVEFSDSVPFRLTRNLPTFFHSVWSGVFLRLFNVSWCSSHCCRQDRFFFHLILSKD